MSVHAGQQEQQPQGTRTFAKRSPSILVTDVRNAQQQRRPSAPFVKTPTRQTSSPSAKQKHGFDLNNKNNNYKSGRFDNISIDNILSDISEIPSAQKRSSSAYTPIRPSIKSGSSRKILDKGKSAISKTTRDHQGKGQSSVESLKKNLPPVLTQALPIRTTKVSEKLVLIPEEGSPRFRFEDEEEEEDQVPPKSPRQSEDHDTLPRRSYAEKLPKDKRTNEFPRVTAYCISDAVRLHAAADYLHQNHKVRPRIYDEALFAPYFLPLLPGDDKSGSRVKSSSGSIIMLERLIDRSEQGDHHYEYFSGLDREQEREQEEPRSEAQEIIHSNENHHHDDTTNRDEWKSHDEFDPSEPQDFSPPSASSYLQPESELSDEGRTNDTHLLPEEDFTSTTLETILEEDERRPNIADDSIHAEMFIFSYGVVVFWNFTERQEKDVLADLRFAKVPVVSKLNSFDDTTNDDDDADDADDAGNDDSEEESDEENELVIKQVILRPISDQDIETEELHFHYSPNTQRPRIYNDMITLKSGDHMIKLAMSHAIAQSTKLSRFEARMDGNMHDVKHVPRMLALTGNLGMHREDVLKISGKLFKLRVDVNLSSNVLDTPDFFWEAEPSLNPLYTAVREYLEIEQRILVLNERCKVFLELTDIIADSIAESNMSRITWIIIILILLSLAVSSLEIAMRFNIVKENVGS
jgi:uncharacterized Rmd1/YagE family protein